MRRINLTENLIYLIFFYVIIETFFYPVARNVKVYGNFPRLILFNYRFTISEIIIFCFILVYFILLMLKIIKSGKVNLGPKPAVFYILIIILLIFGSVLIGLFNKNELFFNDFRLMVFTLTLYVIFLNIDLSSRINVNIYNILFYSSIIFTLANIITWLKPNFHIISSSNFSNIYTLTYSVFLFNISLSRIIFKKFSVYYFLLMFFSSAIIILNIINKTMVFSLFVSIMLFILMTIYSISKKELKLNKFIIILLIILLSTLAFTSLSSSIKEDMYEKYKYKYLNIGRGSEGDLSTGRFDIWKAYLNESIKGLGVSRYGLGYEYTIVVHKMKHINVGEHNILVYFALQFGCISAVCLIFLILMFFYKGFSFFIRHSYNKKVFFEEYQMIGIFIFLVSQISINMTGLRLADVRTAWIFWFLLTILLKQWRLIERNEIKKQKN
ncbi:hypothetical protein CVT91_00625 [Candidatus Atribacteria bacterium HGW-Atribacteria-1]|nr:MAG: hypothetical protein CVT91_00625 [Candidatus Atribacteria bacterium HGW-Atribacteria-1]